MERRNFLRTVTSGALAAGISPLAFANTRFAESAIIETTNNPEPIQLKNTSYSWVRGFNYQPGYGRHGIDTWCNFKPKIIQREIFRGKELFPEMTALRIWLSFDAFLVDPRKTSENFSKVIDIIGKAGLKAMPVFFNTWHSIPDWGGLTPQSIRHILTSKERSLYMYRFVDAILERHISDDRIFAWDLCNEPYNSFDAFNSTDGVASVTKTGENFTKWLTLLHDHIKSRNENSCLTIGQCVYKWFETVEPLCDLISVHPYGGLNPDLVARANKFNKPMIASEIGSGSLDDADRVKRLHKDLSSCTNQNVGFLIHALNYSRVADLFRSEDGPVGQDGYMGCIEKDGSIRPGHEIIRDYLKVK